MAFSLGFFGFSGHCSGIRDVEVASSNLVAPTFRDAATSFSQRGCNIFCLNETGTNSGDQFRGPTWGQKYRQKTTVLVPTGVQHFRRRQLNRHAPHLVNHGASLERVALTPFD